MARNEKEREILAKKFDVQAKGLDKVTAQKSDVIICTISSDISIDLPLAHNGAHAIDLRYRERSQFLKDAQTRGYQIHDGLPMLLHQALEQFRLFTGIQPTEDDLHAIQDATTALIPTP